MRNRPGTNPAGEYRAIVAPGSGAGFTLVEVLIVIGIFAVISMVSYTSLSQYINVSEKLEQNSLQIQRLQKAFTLLERDLRYMVNRPVRDEYGDAEDAFLIEYVNGLPGEQLRFTTVHPDYALPGLGQLQRVAWRIDNNELFRDSWPKLDRASESEPNSLKVLENVDSFDIEQFSWSDDLGLQQGTQFGEINFFPIGIRITMTMVDGKEYARLFDLANGT
jgi:general secretion pathway protein J